MKVRVDLSAHEQPFSAEGEYAVEITRAAVLKKSGHVFLELGCTDGERSYRTQIPFWEHAPLEAICAGLDDGWLAQELVGRRVRLVVAKRDRWFNVVAADLLSD